jgi:hypothetical protein
MNKNNKILLLIVILLILLIFYKYVYFYKDNFKPSHVKELGEYDANKDGKMIHKYVVDPNYDNDIKNNYYLNDDTKVNNIRLVFHPYQIKSRAYYGSTDPPPLPKMQSAIQMFLLRLRLLGFRV